MKIPLIVEVETKDGRIRNVVLCMGHTDLEDHENDESIAYYFDDDEASEPKHLIGRGVFGDVEEEGDAIVKVHGISTFPEFQSGVTMKVRGYTVNMPRNHKLELPVWTHPDNPDDDEPVDLYPVDREDR